ncbi:MAG: GNAT family N-acetyltransferase [Chloroflexota bacterium]
MTGTEFAVRLPNAPAIPGLEFRHWRGFDDLPGMAAVNQRTRDEAGVEERLSIESMTATYSNLDNCDLGRDLLVVERDGRTIGYVRVEWRNLTNGRRQFVSFGVVDPAERGRGIGQAMLTWSEGRLAEIAAAVEDDRPGEMFSYTFSNDDNGTSLLEENGWTAVARGYEMVRPTLDDIPDIAIPVGLEVRDVDGTDRRKVWEAAREAFRDHRDEQEWTDRDWEQFLVEFPDHSLWVVAFDGDEVAGGVLNSIDDEANRQHRRTRGAVGSVWTGARWRRRGVARALVARSLALLRDRGMTSAYIGVDGANPNQAMDLYASVGFEVSTSTIDWRKPLPTAGSGPKGEAT